MTIDRLINVLVMVTVIQMMATVGLSVSIADLLGVARNWRLVARAATANYILAPAATVGLLLLMGPHPMVAAGFLILAACPGAPYGPPLTKLAKGSVADAVGLMVILAASSAIVAPLLLSFLLPFVSSETPIEIDPIAIVATLLATQLAPLCAGLALRHFRPAAADSLQRRANFLSKALNLVTIGLIVVVQFPLLMEIRLRGFVGMLALLAVCGASGWLLAGRDSRLRKALSLTTALRNTSVALVVASGAFAGTPAVTAVAAYGLVSLVGALAFAAVAGAATRPASSADQQFEG